MSEAVNNEPGRIPELEALTDALPNALMAIDRQGMIVLANTCVSRMLGLSQDERLDGKPMWQVLPEGLRELVAAMQREVLIYGVEAHHDVELTLKDGVHKLLDVYLAPVAGGGEQPEFFSLTLSEAVDRQEVVELKKLDMLKLNFLAMISHELRTPLTSIRGAVHLLADCDKVSQDDPNKTLVGIIQSNSDRLIRLVNNLLEMVAIDNHTFVVSPSRVDVEPLVVQALEKSRAAAEAKFLKLESKGSAGIGYVDPERLVQMITYLVDNAIKFTPHGGHITVSTALGTEGALSLVVSDNGPGVPPHARERIFDRFYQVEDPMTRCTGGAGVGLFLARHIAEAHRGRLWMDGNPAGGADFRALFPAENMAHAAESLKA